MFVNIGLDGSPKEIADLVAALQSRRIPLEMNPTAVAQSICDSRPEAQEKSCS